MAAASKAIKYPQKLTEHLKTLSVAKFIVSGISATLKTLAKQTKTALAGKQVYGIFATLITKPQRR